MGEGISSSHHPLSPCHPGVIHLHRQCHRHHPGTIEGPHGDDQCVRLCSTGEAGYCRGMWGPMMWRGHKIRLGFHNSPECQAGDGQRSQVSTAWVDTWDLWSAEQGCDSPGLWHRSQPAPVSEREGPFGAGGGGDWETRAQEQHGGWGQQALLTAASHRGTWCHRPAPCVA